MINRIEELVNTPGIVNLELEDFGDINKIKLYKKTTLINNKIELSEKETRDVNFIIVNIIEKNLIKNLQYNLNYVNSIKRMIQANFSNEVLIIYSYFIDENINETIVELFLSSK